jgi:hypothetical protein
LQNASDERPLAFQAAARRAHVLASAMRPSLGQTRHRGKTGSVQRIREGSLELSPAKTRILHNRRSMS